MHKMTTRDVLAQLIQFPTVSRDSNLELMAFIRDYLLACGVHAELFHNAEGTKASLFATIGPPGDRGIILSGHTDVVPVDGQHWTMDPFQMRVKDGKAYRRGTADMKGFIACVLAAVPWFVEADTKAPIHLAFSYDEEVGCLGVRPMLAELASRALKARLCLIGEPTGMRPVSGHKGKLAMRCCVRGAACHSAYAPDGVNAIAYAAKLINRLDAMAAQLARAEHHDARFDPPYSTIQTGLIQGGSALNIVPAECVFDFEIRALPDFDAQTIVDQLQDYAQAELLPVMQAVQTETGIDMQILSAYPGLASDPASDAAVLLAALTGANGFGTVAFGSEAGLFAQAGIPSLVCGPGSMEQGHKPDEYVSLEQLSACDLLLRRLVAYL